LQSLGVDLKFVTITSGATLEKHSDEGVTVAVKPTANTKCDRCWHYTADIGANAEHPTICGRCISNLNGNEEPRAFA
jgi:isoleucyl-tRNA synthetase